jgi:hypothetical protein
MHVVDTEVEESSTVGLLVKMMAGGMLACGIVGVVIAGTISNADGVASFGWDEVSTFTSFAGWDSIPDEGLQAHDTHDQHFQEGFADWDSIPDDVDDFPDDDWHTTRREAGHPSNKRKREHGHVEALTAVSTHIQAAVAGNVPCTHVPPCKFNDCAKRIVQNVSAADLHHKLTWRHHHKTNERDVAAAFCTEIRAFGRATSDGMEFAPHVAGEPCCMHSHAFFNGLWCESENRPSKTHRQYVHDARHGSRAEQASLANDTSAQKDAQRRQHAVSWITERIISVAQTYPVMAGGANDVEVDDAGAVVSQDWEYRIRPVIVKHEWKLYNAVCESDGLKSLKYDAFRGVWVHVTTNVLNVSEDKFNNVCADCFECVEYNSLVHKYRLAGGSRDSDRLAAQAQKEAHIQVIMNGHRAGKDKFAARSRNKDSDWLAIEFDGVDNSHTHVPYLNYCENKNYHSMEKIKFKTTGFVEFGHGVHFWHAQPWLGSHRSVNLNITTFFLTVDAILGREGKLSSQMFAHCDAGDGNWDDAQCVLFAMTVQADLVRVLIVHRSPVAHTHDIGDAYWSIQSTDCKGRRGKGGHDLTTPSALLESFQRSYGHLKGEVHLQSNAFVEATLDFVSIANDFVDNEFSLGGLKHNYIHGTDTVNAQKFRESHAWRFQKDASGQVKMQYLDRQDFIDGKRMHIDADWSTHEAVQILKPAPSAATQKADILARFEALDASGWRRPKAGDSEGWVGLKKSKSEVLNYARRQDKFSPEALIELQAYYNRAPTTEEEFEDSLAHLPVPSMERVVTYCRNVNTLRAERNTEIQERQVSMNLSGAGTVPNVLHRDFTASDRARASRSAASAAEYETDEPVAVGEFVFASVAHDESDAANYELPISFGIVHNITSDDGETIDESTTANDQLLIGWFQPTLRPPNQKYGPGWWKLMRNPEPGADATRDVQSTIERGAVVMAGITDEGHLIGGKEKYLRGGRVVIKCKFSQSLLRKLAELPNNVTQWSKYGVTNVR